jgi:hypothetical protein
MTDSNQIRLGNDTHTTYIQKIVIGNDIVVGIYTMTQTLLGFLRNVTSDIQQQFTNVTTAISTSITNLLNSTNTFTELNTFNKHLRLGDKLFFGSNNNNFIGFTTKSVNNYKLTLSGADQTAIGYLNNEQQLVVDSNGIKINTGTVNANSLTLGTNILSSDLLFFLNKLKQNMQYIAENNLVSFTNTLLIAGISRGQNVTIDNGNIIIEGTPTSGITIGGNKINSTLWGKLAAIFSGNITYTGYNTFNRLTSITNAGQGPYLRTQQYFIGEYTRFNSSAFGINQLIILSNPSRTEQENNEIGFPSFTGIELPNPNDCQGQTVNIYHSSNRTLQITINGSSRFLGKKTGTAFNMVANDVVILQSNYYYWIVLSS